mmetsp:Transcript_28875/g.47878  ORF Transcript_28875/g.47878 Transcript_28875/m.47878 type:complete len:372 (+) Transcript_28875:76-1191(+)
MRDLVQVRSASVQRVNVKFLAVATSVEFNSGIVRGSGPCGLIKWCYSAARFAKLPFLARATEAVVLTNNVSQASLECRSEARFIEFDPDFKKVVDRWKQLNYTGSNRHRRAFSGSTLMKWQLFALRDYDAVLFTDVDVDLFLSNSGRPPLQSSHAWGQLENSWTVHVGRFMRSRLQLLASKDTHAPINTAVMLLKPSRKIFDIGKSTLETRRFDFQRGFNLSGPPRSIMPWAAMSKQLANRINGTRMGRVNTWNFVCGEGDQGLFTYVFHVLMQAATFTYPTQDDGFVVDHFFSGHKPWRSKTRCLQYFDFMHNNDFMHGPTRCLQELQTKMECLLPGLNRTACTRCNRLKQKSSCIMPPRCPPETKWWVL